MSNFFYRHTIYSYSLLVTGLRNLTHFHDCYTAMIDLGPPEEDPGLVPDGAKCGEEMVWDVSLF